MAKISTSFYMFQDGLKAYERMWEPETQPRACIVLLHGFSDQVNHYDTFFNILLKEYPVTVIGWDRRGWGKSVRQSSDKGNTGPMEKQMDELNEYLQHVFSSRLGTEATPVFLMGHSMGGQETAYYMLSTQKFDDDARSKISGIILESPYIGLDPATQPSALKVNVGKLACRLIPHFQLKNPVEVEFISPDVEVQNMYKNDPLCHGIGTLECFRDMLQRAAELTALGENPSSQQRTLSAKLPCPALWTHGTADKATDYNTSKKLCESLEPYGGKQDNKVFKSYDGWFHQLHSEPKGCKEQYAKDIGDWIMTMVA